MARRYQFVRLASLGRGELVIAADLLSLPSGRVIVGGSATSDTRAKSRPCIWEKNGKPQLIEDVSGYSRATVHKIVSEDLMVGNCNDHIAGERIGGAVIWTKKGAEELAPVDGYDSASAGGATKSGIIVGMSYHSDVPLEKKATIWFDGNVALRHPRLEQYPSSVIRSINSSKIAVGKLSESDRSSAIGIWRGTDAWLLDSADSTQGGAYIITDSNLVIGQIGKEDHGTTAVWQLAFDAAGKPVQPFKCVQLIVPQKGLNSAPVLHHGDKIRVVYNAKVVDGSDAGIPVPYLFEAENLEELARVKPIDLNKELRLPTPWDRIESVMAVGDNGVFVAHARYGREESALLAIPE